VAIIFSEGKTMSKSIKHWQDPVNLILGLWMLASPWVLNYQAEPNPTWNAVVVGVLIAAVAVSALVAVMAWQEWANVVLGIWLAISPWVLGFTALSAVMWNAVVVGLLVAVFALWAVATDKKIGGWWSPAS
jgi:hypothetical protein